jgi:hypothetical protein
MNRMTGELLDTERRAKGVVKLQTKESTATHINFVPLLGKIILCRKSNGKEFVSLLDKIEGDQLTFVTRRGKPIINCASEIVYVAEV